MTVLNRPASLFLVAFISICTLVSCDTFENRAKTKIEKENKKSVSAIHKDTLASVNGIHIGKLDVDYILKKRRHNRKVTAQTEKTALKMIIQQELIYQKAVELGLDKHADKYQEQIRRREAELNAFKRVILAKQFHKQEIINKAIITEDEIKTYFSENLHKIQTEFHVGQLLYKGNEKAINDDLNDIKAGASFEDVAKRKFSDLPKKIARNPWDLGYLRWNQIPEVWQDVIYGMKNGETSGIIKGPKKRFWIIKLIDRRENPNPDFEKSKSIIKQILKNRKIEALSDQWEKKLRDEAEIIYYESAEKEKVPPIEH